jgi:dihydroorotate dehydrogenase
MTYRLVRSVAFRVDAERAHRHALALARLARPLSLLRPPRWDVRNPVDAFGLRFRNPLGLAAGYDKDGTAWRALAALGFGHVEIGTVTPRPQPGNPRPRVIRLTEQRALVNRMGFPSEGADAVAARMRGRRPGGVVLGVSIGPNADTPPDRRVEDYLTLVDRFAGPADYLAVNVSSPNTAGLRDLQGEALEPLLRAVVDRAAGEAPVLVKLSPDLPDVAPVVAAAERAGVHGIITSNTTVTRPLVEADPGPGGLSGAPLAELARRSLEAVLRATRLPVIACGGVMTPADAQERLDAGAALVQIYTGLVYAGPRLVRHIVRTLA